VTATRCGLKVTIENFEASSKCKTKSQLPSRRHEKAEHQLRAAVDRDPLFDYANFHLGNELYLQGKFSDAETIFRRLLEISPRFKWTRPYLAKALPAQGKLRAALDALQPMAAGATKLDYLSVILQANDRTPDAFTCATTWFYLMHHGFKRERQMPALNEFARGRGKNDFPAILLGDFNTDPESAEIRYLKGLQSLQGGSAYWCDAWDQAGDGSKGTTWSRSNNFAAWAPLPNRRIDYIFVAQPRLDGASTIDECSVVCNERADGVWPSDHFGVFARLRVT